MTAKTTMAAKLQSLFEANKTATVLSFLNDGDGKAPAGRFNIVDLDAKTQKMKDGSKGKFLLIKEDGNDEATVISLAPEAALNLLTGVNATVKGIDGWFHIEGGVKSLSADEPKVEAATEDATVEAAAEEGTTGAPATAEAGTEAPTQEASAAQPDEKAVARAAREKEAADRKAKKEAEKQDKEAKRMAAEQEREAKRVKEKADQARRAREKETNSKKLKALAIYQSIPDGTEGKRKKVIEMFKTDLDMGDAGANTYYQNFKSGHWK